MYKILDLKRVFSTFQETVWSLLKRSPMCLYIYQRYIYIYIKYIYLYYIKDTNRNMEKGRCTADTDSKVSRFERWPFVREKQKINKKPSEFI